MKKLWKVLLGIFGGLGALIMLLVLLCYFNPGLSDRISQLLYSRDSEVAQAVTYPKNSGERSNVADTVENNDNETTTTGIRTQPDNGYVPVNQDSLQVPKELTEKTGYEPVQDTGEEIDQNQAEKLRNTLGYGNTGDGLTFDAIMYPYYQMLDDTLQSLYRQIYANANDLTKSFAPVVLVSPTQLKNTFMAVIGDHPELFWIDTGYSYKYTGDGTAEIDLLFNQTADNLDASKSLFNQVAQEIVNQAQGLTSDYEKEVKVHDLLISQVTYNLNAPMNQSAYSALVNGQTVCAGYARAFQYLMQQINVPCYYCTGYAGENHAWNIIKLDDGYYNVDTTWDDTDPNTYDYFNCSDADYAKDHVRKDLSVYLPACNGEKYRGLLKNQEVVQSETASSYTGETLTDLQSYYNDCYNQLANLSGSSYSFQNVVKGKDVIQQIYAAYENQDYKNGYLYRSMQDKGISQCNLNISIEEMDGDCYLITHSVTNY